MPTSVREFADRTVEPHVVGFLHTPEHPNGNGFVLTHGAGGNAQAPMLRAIAEIFAQAGFTVLRCNLPYRQARSFGPPGPGDAARDRAGLKNAIAAVKKIRDAPTLDDVAKSGNSGTRGGSPSVASGEWEPRFFLGGHSYGGRQSSILCAEEPGLVAGLLLLSYPLHPPRKPEQQRTQHLPDLRTATLFVHGTRDPFASTTEMEQAIRMIPAKTKLLEVEGAGHDLGFKGRGSNSELTAAILENFQLLLA